MRKEEILKKTSEIMKHGDFGLLSDYEVTEHVSLLVAKWVEKTILDGICDYLKNTLYTRNNGAEHYVASKDKISKTEFLDRLRKMIE